MVPDSVLYQLEGNLFCESAIIPHREKNNAHASTPKFSDHAVGPDSSGVVGRNPIRKIRRGTEGSFKKSSGLITCFQQRTHFIKKPPVPSTRGGQEVFAFSLGYVRPP